MSDTDTELDLDYQYKQNIKKEIAHEELITMIEENCSEFVYQVRQYLDAKASPLYESCSKSIFSVKVYNFIINFLEKLK